MLESMTESMTVVRDEIYIHVATTKENRVYSRCSREASGWSAKPQNMASLFRCRVRYTRHIVPTSSGPYSRFSVRLISTPAQAYLEPVKSGILAITLDRPKTKNAISTQLLREFRSCITTAGKDRSYVSQSQTQLNFTLTRAFGAPLQTSSINRTVL